MKHLGDITKLNGAEIEPVWVITGGSPCQDLSIAGRRAGLAGDRSGLFMEQIRIVKEMRERERSDGRTGELVRPRYMVWENVPGALSSNGGNDFAAVLEEIIKIAEPEAPHIQVPEHGWPTWGGYRDVGGRWSVAYRVHDAQWYGVPQRRRRISVVADFGGSTAHEILFEPRSVSGNPTESGAQGKRPAGAVKSGSYPAVARSLTARYDGSPCVDRGPNIICEPLNQSCLTAWDCQSKRIFDTNGVSPTLQGGVGGGVNNPALFCANPWDAQSARLYDADGIYASLNANSGGGQNRAAVFCMATQQGGAEILANDKAPVLTAAAGMSGNNQPVISFTQNQRDEVRDLKDKAGSLSAQPGMKQQTYILDGRAEAAAQTVVIPINDKATRYEGGGDTRKNDGAGNGLGVGKDGDPAPTLTSADKHIVAAFKSGQGVKAGGIGYQEEVSPTLSAVSSGSNPVPAIFDMSHANDVIRECSEVAPSLQARMGTGGNQVPLTYQDVTGTLSPGAHAGSYNGQDAYNDMLVVSSEISPTLRAKANDPYRADMAAYIASVDCQNFREGGETNGTLQAKSNGGTSYNLQNTVRTGMVVRRLTPLECTRLQGFPDRWVDIGEWTDEKGRVHKEADGPKYKALGNSIALPFWKWLLRRISEYLPAGATLGSLFDGIGGFPLCWAEIHGAENCRWASEIEQFPIAVVKRHFGDEDAGIVGDVDKFLKEERVKQ